MTSILGDIWSVDMLVLSAIALQEIFVEVIGLCSEAVLIVQFFL